MKLKGNNLDNYFTTILVIFTFILSKPEISLGEDGSSVEGKGNRTGNCTVEFTLANCKPFRTYRSCENGVCTCPTNVQPPLLQNNLTIDTYWNEVHRQCVSKLNSVCFYVPPSIQVSQPYRCLVDNAECVHAPGQFNGAGYCKCMENFHESEDGKCQPNTPEYIRMTSSTDSKNLRDVIENSIKSNATLYDTYQPCTWKFQCPHLQECIHGHCECPTNQWHEHGYKIHMAWNARDNICESLEGSYCNNANFQNPEENMIIKSILKSMLEVRCAPGLNCTDSKTFEIGICSAANRLLNCFVTSSVTFAIWYSLTAMHWNT
ncbi:unnamed protein product [Allacma fusca]|uniref:Uncharacterized protein n=1 Tax=Allacma fusca TaxID=39272 RepID=A0A8J2PK69_9HEXA|nr:unnamed protein product [Allacma fusca]